MLFFAFIPERVGEIRIETAKAEECGETAAAYLRRTAPDGDRHGEQLSRNSNAAQSLHRFSQE